MEERSAAKPTKVSVGLQLLCCLVLTALLATLVVPAMAASNQWTWVSGSDERDQVGVYGVKGTSHPDNVPGGREQAVSWIGDAGSMWLFGGCGYDKEGDDGDLNDLWRYDPATGEWTWTSGADVVDEYGVYGTQGTPHDDNVPGARCYAVSWADDDGGLWLFGGLGYAASTWGRLNDLWRYDTVAGQWTWMSGSDEKEQFGVYGTEGTPHLDNVPGARTNSVSWIDDSGRLWLFGGSGRPRASGAGYLNDLWRFDPDTGEWTWISGSDELWQPGVYGTQGTPHPDNVPGARSSSVSWIDDAGFLWLFGGYGYAATGGEGHLNDLWRFDPATGHWTWISGADVVNQAGVYGTKGIPRPANVPGARDSSSSWINDSGRLWLFAGNGYDGAGDNARMNDLWRFDPATGEWTWISGADVGSPYGVYGTKGVPHTANAPGGRTGSVSWIDDAGSLWLFGGYGPDKADEGGELNDLWRFAPADIVYHRVYLPLCLRQG